MSGHLCFEGVDLTFARRDGSSLPIFTGLDLAVAEGEFLSVVGPSGCGKSTLLRLADGLLQTDGGVVTQRGEVVEGPRPATAMVFQDDLLLPWRTVEDNVLFPLEIQGRIGREHRERVSELLEIVGLHGFASSYPHELSGGMRQRVNLARGLITDPDILLLDEPFSALDAQTREVMQEQLLDIWSRFRKTVLFITHQIDEAVYLSDRVVVLSRAPGGICDEVVVDLERPRPLELKRDPRLTTLVDRIWGQVMAEARVGAVGENA